MNRTPAGLQRRQRLEEAIVPGEVVQASTSAGEPIASGSFAPTYATVIPQPLFDSFPEGTTNPPLWDQFMQIYQPESASDRSGATLFWLNEVHKTAAASPLLQTAVQALAVSRVRNLDEAVARSHGGQELYGRALQALSDRLSKQTTVCDDETLAAAR